MAKHLITGDVMLKSIKPGDPRKRISDGEGLYLLLFVKGGAHGWRLSYSHEGKRKLLSLGTYPGVTLAMARRRAEEARTLVIEGADPSDARKQAKTRVEQQREQERLIAEGKPLPETFEALAREWYAVRSAEWAPGYSTKVIARLEGDVFPFIGRRPAAGRRADGTRAAGGDAAYRSARRGRDGPPGA